ncbi:hypothetical protein SEVIR_9G355101v4 [Setaria viridis]
MYGAKTFYCSVPSLIAGAGHVVPAQHVIADVPGPTLQNPSLAAAVGGHPSHVALALVVHVHVLHALAHRAPARALATDAVSHHEVVGQQVTNTHAPADTSGGLAVVVGGATLGARNHLRAHHLVPPERRGWSDGGMELRAGGGDLREEEEEWAGGGATLRSDGELW